MTLMNLKKIVTILSVTSALIGTHSIAFSETEEKSTTTIPTDFKNILEKKCISCHGEKEKIKGDFNIVKMLDKTIHSEDMDSWAKVVTEIQSNNMPPEEEESPLSETEKNTVLTILHNTFDNTKNIESSRLITPDELKYTAIDIFKLDHINRKLNPAGNLEAYIKNDNRYYTIDNGDSVNTFFFTALGDSVETLLRKHNADNKMLIRPYTTYPTGEAYKKMAAIQLRKYMKKEPNLKKAQKIRDDFMTSRLRFYYVRVNPNSKNHTLIPKFPMKFSPTPSKFKSNFLEYGKNYWGIRGRTWITRYYSYMDLRGGANQQFFEVPPGKYRLTVKASAAGRNTISNLNRKPSPLTEGKEEQMDNYKRLENEKCKLSLFSSNRTWMDQRLGPIIRTPLASFHIEDDKIQEYTAEFNNHGNTAMSLVFSNGIYNLRGTKAQGQLKKQVEGIWELSDESVPVYVPTIRLYDVTLEKLDEIDMGDLYIKDLKSFDDKKAKEKITTLVDNLYLSDSEKFIQYHNSLRKLGQDPYDAFVWTVKSIFLSADFLYLKKNSSDFKSLLRFASYSLLKTTPTKEFEQLFKKFLSKEMSSSQFTEKLVHTDNFRYFVESFSDQWMHLDEMALNVPDKLKYPDFENNDLGENFLAQTYATIEYLFKENRKISELVKSDYAFLNDELANFYGIENITNLEMKKINFSSDKNVGILSHASFMMSASNGVEGLPFRRSKWISENIVDKIIPDPPNDIDVSNFIEDEKNEDNSFTARIKSHIIDKKCADCHKLLDGIAISVHALDMFGNLRKEGITAYELKNSAKDFKKHVTSTKNRRIASAFTKNILSFIMGRKASIKDLILVNKILDDVKAEGYRTRDILERIIFYNMQPKK